MYVAHLLNNQVIVFDLGDLPQLEHNHWFYFEGFLCAENQQKTPKTGVNMFSNPQNRSLDLQQRFVQQDLTISFRFLELFCNHLGQTL